MCCHLSRSDAGKRMSTEAARWHGAPVRPTHAPLASAGHSLRVSTARDLLAAGVNLPSLMKAGRWSMTSMPVRYSELRRVSRGCWPVSGPRG